MKSEKDKQKALALYLEGKSEMDIAKELKISRATVQKWKKLENWSKSKEESKEKTRQKIINKYADLGEKHTELTYKAIIEALNRLPTMKDINIVSLSKLPTPTNQLNLTQEVNKGIIYQFEVKHADKDKKNTIIKKATRSISDSE